MTGKTHRVGGMLCVLGGYTLLDSKGLLFNDVSPVLQLVIMYPFAIYGSIVSDLDHNWHSAPSKDVFSYFINKILHLTTELRKRTKHPPGITAIFDAKHRSWQTHSDLFLLITMALAIYMTTSSVVSADQVLVKLVFSGLISGIISHLVLDMLTPEGIWSLVKIFMKRVMKIKIKHEKISLVPNTSFFRTGGKWEDFIRGLMWVICILLFIWILYCMSPYNIDYIPVK